MVNRRERVRAATVQEIKDVARRQLVTDGQTAVSLRAIAREMGMTAPALYRYFPSFDHLVRSLVDDLFGEVCAAMEDSRDLLPAGDADGRLIAACRTFRAWAVSHRAEYGLLFRTPMTGSTGDLLSAGQTGSSRFGAIFFDLFADVWRQHSFAAPQTDNLDPRLVQQLTAYRQLTGGTLPLGVMYVILSCWSRLYGLVSLEVFNHLRFAITDGEPFFEEQLRELAAQLGMAPLGMSERIGAAS